MSGLTFIEKVPKVSLRHRRQAVQTFARAICGGPGLPADSIPGAGSILRDAGRPLLRLSPANGERFKYKSSRNYPLQCEPRATGGAGAKDDA
jgi:hypothetical protein